MNQQKIVSIGTSPYLGIWSHYNYTHYNHFLIYATRPKQELFVVLTWRDKQTNSEFFRKIMYKHFCYLKKDHKTFVEYALKNAMH